MILLVAILAAGSPAMPVEQRAPLQPAEAQKMAYVIGEAQMGMERFCPPGQHLQVSFDLSHARRPGKVEVTGPDCARREMEAVKRWLETRPAAAFLPVQHQTRFRFRVRLAGPQ